jgi:hypothetical protein
VEAIPLHSALYLFVSRSLLNCKSTNKKCYKFVATLKENYGAKIFSYSVALVTTILPRAPYDPIIKAEFISRPVWIQPAGSNTPLCDCEQGFFVPVYGNPDFAGISITSAPRDHSFSDSIASRNGIWRGVESGRRCFGHKDNTRRNKHIFKL